MTTPRVLLFDGDAVHESTDAVAALSRVHELPNAWMWVQCAAPADGDVEGLAGSLGLPDHLAREIVRRQSRARLIRFDDDVLLVLQPATYDDADETVTTHELDVVMSDRVLFTVDTGSGLDLAAPLRAHPGKQRGGPFVAVWSILHQTADGYRRVLEGLENDVDEIEEQLFGEDASVSRRIFSLQREVIGLAHATSPLPEVLERLAELAAARAEVPATALQEVHERARYAGERVAGLRHTLDSALDLHATLVTQRLDEKMADLTQQQVRQNDQVKKISSWAAIGFAPTLVASVYGMNFRNMPELDWPWGYPFALGLMVAVSAGLYALFRRNDWI